VGFGFRIGCALTAFFLGGCSPCGGTRVRVVFDADSVVAAMAKTVHVEVLDAEGRTALDQTFEPRFPFSIELEPGGGDASRRYSLVADLLDESGALLQRQRARSGYVADECLELAIRFDAACSATTTCGLRQTCVAGECASACVTPTDPGDVTRSEPVACPDLPPAFVPTNLDDAVDPGGGRSEVVAGGDGFDFWIFDTADGSIDSFDGPNPATATAREERAAGAGIDPTSGIVFQTISGGAASGLGVFVLGRLEIAPGAIVAGIGPRPLVIVSSSDIVVAGRLTVAADRVEGSSGPGAGGDPGGMRNENGGGAGGGGAGGEFIVNGCEGAGGGGGFGSQGGLGGGIEEDGRPTTGVRGAIYGNDTLTPLVGGSGGGGGGGGNPGYGGHGGGALELVAVERIDVVLGGAVDAGGGGGRAGGGGWGGAGGGSGGAILLEAPAVQIAGFVAANGGGGGGPSEPGEAGQPDRAPAAGALENRDNFSGAGGTGSDGSGVAGDGGTMCNSGGGGGGAGRIRIQTLAGNESYDSGLLPFTSSGLVTVGALMLR